ncbi:MAG: hypothetical protein HYY18_19885 [Planctomycetes bacterium]|nr:hypothetical protein [Planctomycetota bacterium]
MKPLLPLLLLLLLASKAPADKVVLNDGRTYEGIVLEDSDKGVKIRTAKATLTFPKNQVKSVERGANTLGLREQKLEALSPENPKGYLEAAEWLAGEGKESMDLPTLRRLCAIAASLDRPLACPANLLLGKALLEAGQRAEAARAFMRAANSDAGNTEAARRWAELRKELADTARKEMGEVVAAIDEVIAGRFPEALPKLRRARILFGAEKAREHLGTTLGELADDVQRRVPCKPCAGKATIECHACKGKSVIRCSVCDGSGKKTGFTAGDGAAGSFSKSVCRSCFGLGNVLCTYCKAERTVNIGFQGAPTAQIPMVAGREREQMKSEIDLINYTRHIGGNGVVSIVAEAPTKGGTRACPTCRGIKFDPPTTPPPADRLLAYRSALDDLISGRAPFEPGNPEELFDASVLEDGALRYKAGKWIE